MVRSILRRLIGCLCFWWSLGLALFFLASGAERIERAINREKSVETISGYPVTASTAISAKVALTFDDGPHLVYTPRLLDGLKERGVCATFFVVGENIPGNEAILKRMDAEGHLIGNHTYSHVKLSDLDSARACAEVEKTNVLIEEATGKKPEFIRPPFGAWKKTMECSLGMLPVLWDVDPLDWTTKNTALVVQRVLKGTEPGDIILLHDYYPSSVDAALQIVDALTEKGYEFVTVDELILE